MDSEQLFDRFCSEYTEWCETGKTPTVCDQDSAFLLEVQKERLAKKAVSMRCRIKPYPGEVKGFAGKGKKICARQLYRTVERDLEFSRGGESQFRLKNDQLMTQVVITDEHPDGLYDRPYQCPNCGNVSDVRSLLDGCDYCGTRFLMDDLFPVVNDFRFDRFDSGETLEKRDRRIINRTRLILFPILVLVYWLYFKADLPVIFLASLIGAWMAGWFFGRVISIITSISISAKGNGEGSVSPKAWRTDKKITDFLSKYDPDFQYDYFQGQLISLLKICMMGEHPEEMCCYDAGERSEWFSDVLDCMCCGHMILNGAEEKDGMIILDLTAYFIFVTDRDGQITSEGRQVRFTAERSASAPDDPNFTVHAVKCPTCGGSFDAAHRRRCPYCSSEYDLKEKDWVIVKMDLV